MVIYGFSWDFEAYLLPRTLDTTTCHGRMMPKFAFLTSKVWNGGGAIPFIAELPFSVRVLLFSSAEAVILLVSTKHRDPWPDPMFLSVHRVLVFSDLPDFTMSRCWRLPEVWILGADQKDHGLWGREWGFNSFMKSISYNWYKRQSNLLRHFSSMVKLFSNRRIIKPMLLSRVFSNRRPATRGWCWCRFVKPT